MIQNLGYAILTKMLTIYSADTRLTEKREAMCTIYNNGKVVWIPQGIFMSTCDINVMTFPFDKQVCSLRFGSWTYDGTKLNLTFRNQSQMETDDYFVPNTAWTVLSAPGKLNKNDYECCPEYFLDLEYTITFQRSATFYTYILILPCVLLTSLLLVLYWIPPESSTKMALGMSIFMAFFVLLMLFERNMPPASENVPVLGTYYCLNMILITASTFLTVFVVNLSFYGARAPVPKQLRRIMFKYIARVLRMDSLVRPFLDADKKRLIPPAVPDIGYVNSESEKWHKNWKGSSELLFSRTEEFEANPETIQLTEITAKMVDIRGHMIAYRERLDEKDRKERTGKEWKAIGLIFDRIFFWIYLVTITTSLSVVLYYIFMGS